MSLRHKKTEEWEDRLKAVFDRIDDLLEDRYGRAFPLHPARPARGKTPNREHSGLFNIGASFSAGIGSGLGPGYVVEIIVATLEPVPKKLRARIEADAALLLDRELKLEFPGRSLAVARDGGVLKIYGDLSLGRV